MALIRYVALLALLTLPASLVRADNFCGARTNDWCTSAKDGACGRHMNEADCRADAKCVAMRYEGESVVACNWDERGFADNCPTVGCKDR
jgi:hypothetical protein